MLKRILQYIKHKIVSIRNLVVKALGLVEVALQKPPNIHAIFALMELVLVNVAAVLRVEFLNSEGLYADNETNRLVHGEVHSRSCNAI